MKVVLHLGAHRTGTTGLQNFLNANSAAFGQAGIRSFCPPRSREVPISSIPMQSDRLIVSEENLIGTMEDCIMQCSLYPTAAERLTRKIEFASKVDTVYFSIRDLAAWWTSAITFCLARNTPLPSVEQVRRIALDTRSWSDVIKDVRKAFPNAKIVVREFNWKPENPKQQLKRLTKWPEFQSGVQKRKKHNARPNFDRVVAALIERGESESLSRLPSSDEVHFFEPAQVNDLSKKYLQDLEWIAAQDDIEFWAQEPKIPEVKSRRSLSKSPEMRPEKECVCFLHIGKTGGTFLKSIFARRPSTKYSVNFCQHRDTLVSTVEDYGRDRMLAFCFRQPTKRFVSGFLSRLRQGRPTFDSPWTAAEAAAFCFFKTPNDLAEALYSDDDRLYSASRHAFQSILHLRLNYEHYLASPDALDTEFSRGRILFCCDTEAIDTNIGNIQIALKMAGDDLDLGGGHYHETKYTSSSELSDLAQANLKRFLRTDYEIYEKCQEISRELGF